MTDIEADARDDGVLIRYDGGNRFISADEVAEMCDTDAPVTVQ